MTTTNEAKHLLLNLPLPDFQTDAERGEYWAKIDKIAAALSVESPSCPPEYQGEGGFFAYDFMPQKIMFKTTLGPMSALDVLNVRGWGHLTGGGALGLPADVAANIQDNFGKWVVETLNAALTRQSEGVSEPVAWQWRTRAGPQLNWGAWRDGRALPNIPMDVEKLIEWEERPLYTHPAQSAPGDLGPQLHDPKDVPNMGDVLREEFFPVAPDKRYAAYEALRTLKVRGHHLPHCEDYQNALHTLMDFVDAAPPEPVQKHTLPSREVLAKAIYEAMQLTNYRSGSKRVPFCNLKKHERWLFNDCMEAAESVRALIGGAE